MDILDRTEADGTCLIWQGGVSNSGYGKMYERGTQRTRSTHRVAYEQYNGELLDGMVVMHTCDNKLCCNPEHLVLGTHKDNSQDMVRKGRWNGSYQSKIDKDWVLCFKGMYSSRQVAKILNISHSSVLNIWRVALSTS